MIYKANLNKAPQDGKNQIPPPMRPVSMYNRQQFPEHLTEAIDPNIPNMPTYNYSEPLPVKKPKKKINLKLVLGLIILFIVVLGGLLIYDRISTYSSRVQQYDEQGNKVATCDNILNPACWTEAFRPQLKQDNGFTTVLIIGVDTRTGTGSLMNTDSIIAITFDHKTQEYMMTSIPRDFWSFTYKSKINAVYALTYKKGKADHNDEFYYLEQEVSNVIGKPIEYVAKIKFDGVVKLVDNLGGIQVCPADAFTAQYPNDNAKGSDPNQWLSFPFQKGCQTIDGAHALVYARFRHVYKGPSYLASDFSRARRQQEIIGAIKTKALADNLSIEQRAETYWALFQSMSDIIDVNISFEDLLAGLSYVNTFDRVPINVVLDPNFDGLNNFIYTDSNPTEGYTIKSKDKTYQNIIKELDKVWQFADFYRETPNIVVRNQTGSKALPADNIALQIKTNTAYYSNFTVYNDAATTKLYGIHIFDFTNGQKPKSAAYLEKFLGVDKLETLPEQYGLKRSSKNEDFLVVVGPPQPSGLPEPTDSVTPSVTATP